MTLGAPPAVNFEGIIPIDDIVTSTFFGSAALILCIVCDGSFSLVTKAGDGNMKRLRLLCAFLKKGFSCCNSRILRRSKEKQNSRGYNNVLEVSFERERYQ